MSRPFCGCSNPRSCSCFHQSWNQQYSLPSTTHPQRPHYSYPAQTFPPWASMNPQLNMPQTFQAFNYEHSFQTSAVQSSDSPIFRVTLGDSTVNEVVTERSGSKRKRGTGTAARARKRTTASTTIPAVAGVGPVGPSMNAQTSGNTIHPRIHSDLCIPQVPCRERQW
jgi:hypothetical protein